MLKNIKKNMKNLKTMMIPMKLWIMRKVVLKLKQL